MAAGRLEVLQPDLGLGASGQRPAASSTGAGRRAGQAESGQEVIGLGSTREQVGAAGTRTPIGAGPEQ
jgi:hypothetical protein